MTPKNTALCILGAVIIYIHVSVYLSISLNCHQLKNRFYDLAISQSPEERLSGLWPLADEIGSELLMGVFVEYLCGDHSADPSPNLN